MDILVVDDDPIAMELLVDALRDEGHTVQTAVDGLDAVEKLQSGSTRVMICDWEMPRMNGPELCRHLRANDPGRYVFTIMLTARGHHDDLVEGLRAGADDFLTKPFDPVELSVRLSVAERVTSLETRDLMIFGMAKLAESRDLETGKHLERVRMYCRVLAEEMGRRDQFSSTIDSEFIRNIYMTSPLHDIGKVGVPDAVLLKPGKLTPEEFKVMQTHTTLGAQTLDAALKQFPGVKFLWMAREIAMCHHERFDGTGYPRGLKGEQIPLSARIVSVADVYDALRSKRVYKPAMSHSEASAVIVAGSGTHLDPHVVGAFLAVEHQMNAVAESMNDVEETPENTLNLPSAFTPRAAAA